MVNKEKYGVDEAGRAKDTLDFTLILLFGGGEKMYKNKIKRKNVVLYYCLEEKKEGKCIYSFFMLVRLEERKTKGKYIFMLNNFYILLLQWMGNWADKYICHLKQI